MLMVLTSPDAVAPAGHPDQKLVRVLTELATNNPVGIVSNHPEPAWFSSCFHGTGVTFLHTRSRQQGHIIALNAEQLQLDPHDVLVLATKREDVQMAKNGPAVLVAAGWSTDQYVQKIGLKVADAQEFQQVAALTATWSGNWWFSGTEPQYTVHALSDLSGFGKSMTQQVFAQKLTYTVKNGGPRLKALLAVTARSLFMSGIAGRDKLMWCTYPSSSSSNDDQEILSDFTHRLRTTVSQVHYAKRGEPLFIRHAPSEKRSTAHGHVDRRDATNQLATLHLNPFYQRRLRGRNVIVVDDCTTYGVSFGVASALLRKAGATSVTGVALGKFGNQLHYFEIDIRTSPFAPIKRKDYAVTARQRFSGTPNPTAQATLLPLVP